MGGKGSGRKAKDINTRQVQQTMTEAAVFGSKLIRDFIRGTDEHGNKVSITMVKLQACLQSIAHGIGLPRQKVEYTHTGEQLTLKDLGELAERFDELVAKGDTEAIQTTIELISKTPKTSKN